ncbi:TRAP transporter small permease [Halalkalibacter hemicellulosilyticus]|uniref:C4-dicarboxylate transport system n=1 Tax=Halalkalibacter hemicellulosilyticusJCM 9152 TaxID=1236971 RepID=W4QI79_9BACI|nr:TRAP transporter small permease [Halalkalibacter hemicellulosilyticus]GAE31801.1 C4-dicarboxylate transport system [Halalkalibacter hemicellulosilyticusJCM 9152]
MSILKKINEHLEEWILVSLLAVSLTSITMQITMRFIFDNSLAWSEELARYCFIWLIYIGIAYGVKRSRHICLDVVYDIVPDAWKKVMLLISNVLVGLFALYVIYYSVFLIEQLTNFSQTSAAMRINMIYVYLSVPIGMAITLLRLIQNLVHVIRNWDSILTEELKEM